MTDTNERMLKAYDAWREESQKFDYFVLGAVGAICAYTAQGMQPERLGFTPFTFELLAIGFLVASAIFGFKRIEHNVRLLRQTYSRLEWEHNLSQLVSKYAGRPLQTNLGELLSPERIETRAGILREAIGKVEEQQELSAERAGVNYTRRNWCLLTGFVILVISRVLHPYLGP